MNEGHYTRRRFLVLVGAVCAGAACAGCSGALAAAGTSSTTDAASTVSTTDTTNTSSAATGSRCPKGLINDPYPGRCRSYRDTNGNGYCDLSEVEG